MASRFIEESQRFVKSTTLRTVGRETSGGYRAAGTRGALLVILPGLVGPADVVASLASELGVEWRVCAVTYPRVDSISALIQWLERLRLDEGGGRAAVYGGSFGGLVAQAWLRACPEAVGDVVLSGTGPPEAARATKNRRAMAWMRRLPMPMWRRLLRVAVFASTIRAEDRRHWRRFYGAAIADLTWPDLESRYRISIGVDEDGPPTTGALARWPGRMLILEGARDRVARRRVREALRETYPRASFHSFAEAGHAPALERPAEWLRVVAEFLRGR